MAADDPARVARAFTRRDLLRRGALTAGAMALGPGALRAVADPTGTGLDELWPTAAVSVPPPAIITRAQWGADESLRSGGRSFATLRKAIVHHTVTANAEPDPAARIRSIYEYHVRGQGWADIGYNFLVDAQGRIYEGRWARAYAAGEPHSGEDQQGRGVVGAHAAGHNTGSFGIAVLGTYSNSAVTPSEPAFEAVTRLIAWKFGPRDIDPRGSDPYTRSDGTTRTFPNISGHRDVVSTGCPGDGFYRRLPELRDRVADQLRRGLVGYRVAGVNGSLTTYGTRGLRDLPESGVAVSARGAVATPTGDGAWFVTAEGSVYSLGDASFHGSMGGIRLNRPIVGMAAHPSGRGYWLVATDGGIFSFGQAGFHGSTGALRLNQPIVGMAAHPSGAGYWLVASDGGIFSFGRAVFRGSTGAIRLAEPIVGMAATPTGLGYWLVARDGGVFSFGDAPFLGSAVGKAGFAGPARGIATTPSGRGYWVVDSAGGVHRFGDAPGFGSGIPDGRRPAVALLPVVRP